MNEGIEPGIFRTQQVSMAEVVASPIRENPFPEGHELSGEREWLKKYSFPVKLSNEATELAWENKAVPTSIEQGLSEFEEWARGSLKKPSAKLILESVYYDNTPERSLLLIHGVETIKKENRRVLSGNSYFILMRRNGEEKLPNLNVVVVVMDDEAKRANRIIGFPSGITEDEKGYETTYISRDSEISQALVDDLAKVGCATDVLVYSKIQQPFVSSFTPRLHRDPEHPLPKTPS